MNAFKLLGKNIIVIVLLIVLLFAFTACKSGPQSVSDVTGLATGQDNVVDDSPVRVTDNSEEPVLVDAPPITNTDNQVSTTTIKSVQEDLPKTVETVRLDPELQSLINSAKDTTKYKYDAREPDDYRKLTHYIISDNKIKIVLPEAKNYDKFEYFNIVYLDTKNRQAIAFCEDRVRCPDFNKPFNVRYEDYIRTTPRDWTMMIKNANIVGRETVNQRPTLVVEFTDGSENYRMSLDTHFGLANRVIINAGQGDQLEYWYDLMGIRVGEDEVVHQFME